jgi:hypothetical protein
VFVLELLEDRRPAMNKPRPAEVVQAMASRSTHAPAPAPFATGPSGLLALALTGWLACLVAWLAVGCADADEFEVGEVDLNDGEQPCGFQLDPCPNDDCGADGRRFFDDLDCDADGCSVYWAGSDVTRVLTRPEFADLQPVDVASVWACEPDPDVDACAAFDDGRVVCVRRVVDVLVAVWPSCAVEGQLTIDVGNGMCAPAPIVID